MGNYSGEKKYPEIFSAGKIGNVEIKNRAIMSSMGCSASPGGYVNQAVINHYAERAKGGVGLILTEVTCVDAPQGLNSLNMLRVDHDHFIPGLTRLAKAIHGHGAKVMLQISHTGRGAKRKVTGLQPVGPSPVAMEMMYMIGVENEEPRALTVPEIQGIEDKYAEAALRAKTAGFDGVEIHSTGYYLGAQFLSRSANIREDEYGGSPENRILFHKNVFSKIRALCGEDFAVCIKATLFQGEDITFEDGAYYAVRFAQIGYAGIEVMAGSTKAYPDKDDLPNTTGPENQMFEMSAAFKGIIAQQAPGAAVQIFSGGRAHEPGAMNEALKQGKCDFVFLGKAIFVEPHLVNLIREDRYDEARPCIGCWLCMTVQLDSGDPGRCSGNAVQGRGDQRFDLDPMEGKKKVVVVGAGIAGVEAAVVAKKRGAEVVLFEERDEPGGQIRFACAAPHKDYIARYIPCFKRLLEAGRVDVRYRTRATAEMVLAEKPDAVICATGVLPAKLSIPGFDKPHVVNAKEVLEGKAVGTNAVIVGGGVIGCETAEFLLSRGKDVTVVEMLPTLAARMLFGNRCVLMAHLEAYGLKKEMESVVTEIKDRSVVVKNADGIKEIPCDSVIISVGDRPNRLLYEALKGKVSQLFCIGDSNTPDSFAESAAAGHYTAAELI
ncbi:MAG: FAD-dependent oxidoreductase [Peptococcaceae bacterium]|nr:FAD-dependent oxidoreductase [Peptococcaceae bacterium]